MDTQNSNIDNITRKTTTMQTDLTSSSQGAGAAVIAPLKLNPEDYIEQLGDFEINEEQKIELLQSLWHIMEMMVDIGFGLDTVQILLPDIFESASRDSDKLIDLKDQQAPSPTKGNDDA